MIFPQGMLIKNGGIPPGGSPAVCPHQATGGALYFRIAQSFARLTGQSRGLPWSGMGLAVELAQIHITAYPLARTARESRLHRAPTRRRGHGRNAKPQGTVPGLVIAYLVCPLSTRRSRDRRGGDGLSHIDTSSQNEKSCLTPQEEGKGARV